MVSIMRRIPFIFIVIQQLLNINGVPINEVKRPASPLVTQDFATGSDENHPPIHPTAPAPSDFRHEIIEPCYPHCSRPFLVPTRFRRQTKGNPFYDSIENIQKIARITNSLYLMKGFVSGSIPSDEFIAELLHLGTFTPTKIKSIDLEKLKKSVEGLKKLPDELKTTKDGERVEDRYLAIADVWKEVSGMGNGALVGDAEYKTEVEGLKTMAINLTLFDDLKNKIENSLNWKNQLSELETSASDYDGKATVILGFVVDSLKSMASIAANARTALHFQHVQHSDTIFLPIFQMLSAVRKFGEKAGVIYMNAGDTDGIKTFDNNMDSMFQISTQLNEAKPMIDNLLSVYATRLRKPVTPPVYLHGFDNVSDINRIDADIRDFKSAIDDPESLIKSMEKLKTIPDIAISTDSALGSSLQKVHAALTELTKTQTTLQSFPQDKESTFSAINLAIACNIMVMPTITDLKGITDFKNNINALKTRVDLLLKLQNVANYFDTEKAALEEVSRLSTVDKSKKIEDTVKGLLGSQKFQKLFGDLSEFQKNSFGSLEDLKTNPLSTFASNVSDSFAALTKFQQELKPLEPKLICLKDVADYKLVSGTIKTLQGFRGTKQFQSGQELKDVEEVGKAMDKLTEFETTVIGLNGFKSNDTDQLSLFEGDSKHSLTIGTSARAIVRMKGLVESKSKFDVVKSQSPLVKSEMSTVTGLSADVVKHLNDLDKVQTMSDELETWKNGVKLPESSKFDGYADIFLGAHKVSGIDDLTKLSESVGKLEGLVNDAQKKKGLKDLKAALDDLNLAGLKLSDYKKDFGDTKASLNALDLFFVKRAKQNAKPTDPPVTALPVPKLTSAVLSSSTVTEEATTAFVPYYERPWVIIVTVILAAVIALVLICLWKGYCCFSKNKKNKKTTDTDKKKPDESQTLLGAAANPDEVTCKDKTPEKDILPKKDVSKKSEKQQPVNVPSVKIKKKEEEKKEEKEENKEKEVKQEVTQEVNPIDPFEFPMNTYDKLITAFYETAMTFQRNQGGDAKELAEETLINFAKDISVTVDTTGRKQEQEPTKDHLEEFREAVYIPKDNRVILHFDSVDKCSSGNSCMNGTCFIMPNKARFFLMGTPFVSVNKGDFRNDDKFYRFIAQAQVRAVVFLASEDELKNETEPNYGNYYPKEEGNMLIIPSAGGLPDLIITCTKKIELEGRIKRTMKVKYFDPNPPPKASRNDINVSIIGTTTELELSHGEYCEKLDEKDIERQNQQRKLDARTKNEWSYNNFKPDKIDHTFEHFEVIDYKKNFGPNSSCLQKLENVSKEIRGTKNVIIHCSDGVERSGSFAYAELLRQKLHEKMADSSGNVDYQTAAQEVRKARPGSMKVGAQILCAIKMVVDEARDKDTKRREEAHIANKVVAKNEKAEKQCFDLDKGFRYASNQNTAEASKNVGDREQKVKMRQAEEQPKLVNAEKAEELKEQKTQTLD